MYVHTATSMWGRYNVELRDFEWFAGLSDEEIAPTEGCIRKKSFDQGQRIFDREEPSTDVYFITSGRVLAVYWTDDGREIVFSRIGGGTQFGELSAIDNAPRSLSIYAQAPTTVLVLKAQDFLKILDTNSTVRHRVYQSLVERIRILTDRSHDLTSLDVSGRVRALLLRSALDAGAFVQGGVLIDMPTHAEIGNTVGANREAVSRVLSAMVKRGVIETSRKRIVLLDPEALVDQAH